MINNNISFNKTMKFFKGIGSQEKLFNYADEHNHKFVVVYEQLLGNKFNSFQNLISMILQIQKRAWG